MPKVDMGPGPRIALVEPVAAPSQRRPHCWRRRRKSNRGRDGCRRRCSAPPRRSEWPLQRCANPTPGRLAADEQGRHHARRVLFTARAAMIHMEVGQGQLLDGVENELNDVVVGNPLAQIAGRKHRPLAVNVHEACGHDSLKPGPAFGFKSFSKTFRLSPTGC